MEFTVQRWLSVDAEDGDVVREVAAQPPAADKPLPGSLLNIISLIHCCLSSPSCFMTLFG